MTAQSMLSLAVSTILGVLFNFFSSSGIVFDNRDPAKIWRFVCVYALIFGVNAAALKLFERFGLSASIAQVILLPFIVVLSYALNRNIVFTGRQMEAGNTK